MRVSGGRNPVRKMERGKKGGSHTQHVSATEDRADIEKSYQWLQKAGLKDSMVSLIIAAQQQALSTRAIEARVYYTIKERRYRCPRENPAYNSELQHLAR